LGAVWGVENRKENGQILGTDVNYWVLSQIKGNGFSGEGRIGQVQKGVFKIDKGGLTPIFLKEKEMNDIEPLPKNIQYFVDSIKQGTMKIPDFQREYVWDQTQILELLDSIYCDYPIGTVLVWASNERLNSPRNIGGFVLPQTREDYPVDYVLDGQQRLTTIYSVFSSDRTQDQTQSEYKVDTKLFDIYFDLESEEFFQKSEIENHPKNIELNCIFDPIKFSDNIRSFDPVVAQKAAELLKKFLQYQIPLVRIKNREKSEVAIIFERINSTGTGLTTLDLMIAWTWADGFHLREKIKEITNALDAKEFGDLPDRVILQCIGAVIKGTTITKEILRISPEEVRDKFEVVKKSIVSAVDFFSTQLKMESIDFLPHIQQIVPVTFLYSVAPNLSAIQLKKLKKWFWKTSFSSRYKDSTDKKMNEDISRFKILATNEAGFDVDDYSYDVDNEKLINSKFSKSSPWTRAFLLLMAQGEPRDLVNGAKIDLGRALSSYNSKEYHHVFPKKHLKSNYNGTMPVNSLCNYCFLPADSNKKISGASPSYYFKNIVRQEEKTEVLNSNLLPIKPDIYLKDNYEEFLTQRANLLQQALDRILV